MDDEAAKKTLQKYLQEARDALVWKLDGLSDYDVRRPLTPTGTNLLGLVKHMTLVEAGYFGDVFGRPYTEKLLWWDEETAEPNADMFATADESREDLVEGYKQTWVHADATIDALPLDATGTVSWWRQPTVSLHQILVHVATEAHRHAGHADIVREEIDGAAGLRSDNSNLPDQDAAWWAAYLERVEAEARKV
ncbi:MAG TPA: DinB family protein [Micromonosporaceae bacterium]|jgi:uncharacterized damage-inducible protein DinB